MPWSKLDDGLHENAKIAAMSDKAFRLYICGITYSARHRLQGFLSFAHVAVLFRLTGAKQKHADELVALRAWEEAEGGYRIHDHSTYNPSQEEISQKRAEAGKKGAEKRWQNGKPIANATSSDSKGEWQTDGKGTCAQTHARNPDPVPDPVPTPKGKRQGGAVAPRFAPPSPEEAEEEFVLQGFGGRNLGQKFVTHYAQSGWRLKGGNKMLDWKAAVQTWAIREREKPGQSVISANGTHSKGKTLEDQMAIEAEAIARLGL